VPEAEIHPRAEKLEHMHDTTAISYLDDLLGHPEKDPHGQQIPEDDACSRPDETVSLSYYHSGRSGVVEQVLAAGEGAGLTPGERITMLERLDQGRTWVVQTADGRKLPLDHAQADAILMRCI
jgi:hypothetical protein